MVYFKYLSASNMNPSVSRTLLAVHVLGLISVSKLVACAVDVAGLNPCLDRLASSD